MEKIPIFIISHNRKTSLKASIDSFRAHIKTPFEIVIHDNRSTIPSVVDYLKSLEATGVKVYWTEENTLTAVADTIEDYFKTHQASYYVVTDPDIVLDAVNGDILHFYSYLLEKLDVPVVGPILRVDDIPDTYPLKDRVLANARPLWARTPDRVDYKGKSYAYHLESIDSTFGLYRRSFPFKPFNDGAQTLAPYGAKHFDWYLDPDHLEADQRYYLTHANLLANWSGTLLRERLNLPHKKTPSYSPNPFLKAMGYAPMDRVVVIHIDDLGMSLAGLEAFSQIVGTGLKVSGSIMAPGPWFPRAARICRDHPEIDVGIHLTLITEYETYRWRPLIAVDTESGMVDKAGYLHHFIWSVSYGKMDFLRNEIQRQMDIVAAAGIKASHMDWHRNAILAQEELMHFSVRHALGKGLLPIFLRGNESDWQDRHAGGRASQLAAFSSELESQGIPLFDRIQTFPKQVEDPRSDAWLKNMLASLPAGLTYLNVHPAVDTPELRAITPSWQAHVRDFKVLIDPGFRDFIKKQDIHLVTCAELVAFWNQVEKGQTPTW